MQSILPCITACFCGFLDNQYGNYFLCSVWIFSSALMEFVPFNVKSAMKVCRGHISSPKWTGQDQQTQKFKLQMVFSNVIIAFLVLILCRNA